MPSAGKVKLMRAKGPSIVEAASRLLLIGGTVGGLALAYSRVIRPWQERWGATASEAQRPLPGDDLLSPPFVETTRAVTIRAPRDRVWPWIAQLGQDRGG